MSAGEVPASSADVLGNARKVERVWPDGSWSCPFCHNAVSTERNETACQNPWCVANPAMPLDAARKIYADAERKARDEKQARDLARWHRDYAAEQARERDQARREVRAQAEERGACVFCAMSAQARGAPVRYVRHRAVCPAQRG